jgi:hypothetical protein
MPAESFEITGVDGQLLLTVPFRDDLAAVSAHVAGHRFTRRETGIEDRGILEYCRIKVSPVERRAPGARL